MLLKGGEQGRIETENGRRKQEIKGEMVKNTRKELKWQICRVRQ
jgi:hypothetical protein